MDRFAYLEAMGIDSWVLRESSDEAVAASPVAEAPIATPTPIDVACDWQGLVQRVSGCNACELHRTRSQTVFGVGDVNADWLVIGEAPGADEDRAGEPFVGRAGQLLNQMLKAIGLAREQVYIANILKCRPPNNRDPNADEVASCQNFLQRQIEWIKPRLILSVGRISAQNLLGSTDAVGKLRGRVHRYPGTDIPLVVTYHPAYLLRSPAQKARAWQDLKLAVRTVRGE